MVDEIAAKMAKRRFALRKVAKELRKRSSENQSRFCVRPRSDTQNAHLKKRFLHARKVYRNPDAELDGVSNFREQNVRRGDLRVRNKEEFRRTGQPETWSGRRTVRSNRANAREKAGANASTAMSVKLWKTSCEESRAACVHVRSKIRSIASLVFISSSTQPCSALSRSLLNEFLTPLTSLTDSEVKTLQAGKHSRQRPS